MAGLPSTPPLAPVPRYVPLTVTQLHVPSTGPSLRSTFLHSSQVLTELLSTFVVRWMQVKSRSVVRLNWSGCVQGLPGSDRGLPIMSASM